MRDKVHSPIEVPQIGRLWCLSWLWLGAASEVALLSTLGLLPRVCGYKYTEEVNLYLLASQLRFCSCEWLLCFGTSQGRVCRDSSDLKVDKMLDHCGALLTSDVGNSCRTIFLFSSALVLTRLQESSVSSVSPRRDSWMSKATVPFFAFL